MTTTPVEVKKDGKLIATIPVEKFDSLDEACTSLGGTDRVLKMVNVQRRNDLCNRARMQDLSPAKQIARITRKVGKGELSKAEAADQVAKLLPLLAG